MFYSLKKIALITFFISCSSIVTEIRAMDPTTKQKLVNTGVALSIGLLTGGTTGVSGSLCPFVAALITWPVERYIRAELIKDIESDSKLIENTAWVGSWIGWAVIGVYFHNPQQGQPPAYN